MTDQGKKMKQEKNGDTIQDREVELLHQEYESFEEMNSQVRPFFSTAKLFLLYVIFGCLWILLSDRVLSWMVGTGERYIQFQSYKGWFYVFITGFVFGVFIYHTLKLYKNSIVSVLKGYEELSATYEELTAMNQELDDQNAMLEDQKETITLSNQRYQLAIEGSKDGIWEWDVVKDRYYVSQRWRELYSANKNTMEAGICSFGVLLYPGDWERVWEELKNYMESRDGIYESTYRVISKSGEVRWILSRGKGYWDNDGKPVRIVGSHTDMTQFFEMEEKLKKLAYYDPLTDLPNKNYLEIKSKEFSGENAEFSLVVLDIDDFKTLNDMYGHIIGDRYIKNIASHLNHQKAKNEIVARIGGGQFAILIQGENNAEMGTRVREIMESLRQPLEIGEQTYFGSCSGGMACYPYHAREYALLFQAAEIAMYLQKEKGKGNYSIFEPIMFENSLRIMEMRNELRMAIDQSEFTLHYQPQYNLISGEMSGMEALIRWNHPVKGFIPPMEFIPFSEKTGHITPISSWVLKTAVIQKRLWEAKGYKPAKMAVNLSGYVITDEESLQKICDVIEELQIQPDELEIEVTETAVMLQLDQAKESLEKLRETGISIAMDDFGTGYSSLTYLHSLPFDIVKIDRDFLKNIVNSEEENEESIMYETVISMAHNMKLRVVAEGVETKEQKEFLIKHHCDVGQGYYFARPLPANEMERRLEEELNG